MSWTIILYESEGGRKPVEDFINTLQPATIAKLRNQLNLLEEFGPRLGMPNAKPVGGGLYELRVRGKEEVRALYIFVKQDRIYLLHGFKKKTGAIKNSDLLTAQKRQKEIL